MKTLKYFTLFLLTAAMALAMTSICYANEYSVDYSCSYNGSEITTDLDQDEFDKILGALEPGDSIKYTATYSNDSDKDTYWYLKTSVLESLENGTAEGSGYIGSLTNKNPDKNAPGVLFDNIQVGGSSNVPIEGLKQLTTATGDYFCIGELKAGESGVVTMSVQFDGESENNAYEDTAGKLLLQFAVEDSNQEVTPQKTPAASTKTKTGDSVNLLLMIALMTAALLAILLTIINYRRDRKAGDQA